MPAQELYSTSPPTIRIASVTAAPTHRRGVAMTIKQQQQRKSKSGTTANRSAGAVGGGGHGGAAGVGTASITSEVRSLFNKIRFLPKPPTPHPTTHTHAHSHGGTTAVGSATTTHKSHKSKSKDRETMAKRQEAQDARLTQVESKVIKLEDAVCLLAAKLDDLRIALES